MNESQQIGGCIYSEDSCGVFSASGVAAKLAKALAEATGAGLYEIKPAVPYTQADLDCINKKSRSTIKMNDPAFRPEVSGSKANIAQYDTVVGQCDLSCKGQSILSTRPLGRMPLLHGDYP